MRLYKIFLVTEDKVQLNSDHRDELVDGAVVSLAQAQHRLQRGRVGGGEQETARVHCFANFRMVIADKPEERKLLAEIQSGADSQRDEK